MKSDEYLLSVENAVLQQKPAVGPDIGRRKLLHRHQLQLLCSFLCGFLMAFTTFIFYDRYLLWSIKVQRHSTNIDYYQTGYMMAVKEMEFEEASLHDRLTSAVRVLCMVLTYPKWHRDRAIHVKRTWGNRCTKLIFMSSETDEDLNAVAIVERDEDVYTKLWNKTRESFRYVYENHLNEYDWFLKADDDTYVIMENLRYMLYAYQPDIPIYFGYEMELNNVTYMSGGASYALSREALKLFMERSYNDGKLCPPAEFTHGEDFCMGVCLQNAGVLSVNSIFAVEEDQKSKFFPLSPIAYTDPKWNDTLPSWLFEMSTATVEVGLGCCSNYTIAFHYMDAAALYTMEFSIYHLQAFSLRHPEEKLPEKIPKGKVFDMYRKNISYPIQYE